MKALISVILFLLLQVSFAGKNCSRVPDSSAVFNFSRACFKHDVCYIEAGWAAIDKSTKKFGTRKHCDLQFYRHMYASCSKYNHICEKIARTYYRGVRKLGGDSYLRAKIATLKYADKLSKRERETIITRFKEKDRWTKKKVICGRKKRLSQLWTFSNRKKEKRKKKYRKCLRELRKIKVRNIPPRYCLGRGCVFNENWRFRKK